MRALFVTAVTLVLLGCGEKAGPQAGVDDFGAAALARYAMVAQDVCTNEGFDDLYSCREAKPMDVRRAALTVQEMERAFNTYCAEALGAPRCNDMLFSALAAAQSAHAPQSTQQR